LKSIPNKIPAWKKRQAEQLAGQNFRLYRERERNRRTTLSSYKPFCFKFYRNVSTELHMYFKDVLLYRLPLLEIKIVLSFESQDMSCIYKKYRRTFKMVSKASKVLQKCLFIKLIWTFTAMFTRAHQWIFSWAH
jgi:hypothetical protein